MVDYNKIKNWTASANKYKDKLRLESDNNTKQKLRLRYKIGILDYKIKIERLN